MRGAQAGGLDSRSTYIHTYTIYYVYTCMSMIMSIMFVVGSVEVWALNEIHSPYRVGKGCNSGIFVLISLKSGPLIHKFPFEHRKCILKTYLKEESPTTRNAELARHYLITIPGEQRIDANVEQQH